MNIISKESRTQIEYEFLSIMWNRQQLLEITLIKPQYLNIPANKKMLTYFMECYEKHKIVNIQKMMEMHTDFNLSYMCEIIDGPYFETTWERELQLIEECIVNWYKEDLTNKLSKDLENKKINYEEFCEKLKKLDDVVLVSKSPKLTVEEIENGINEEHTLIRLDNFPILNKMLEFSQTDFMVIGAQTGTGKSSFLLNLLSQLTDKYQCIYFNLEMSRKTVYKRLISINSGVPINDINNPKTDYQRDNVEKAKRHIGMSNIIIEHKANNLKQIKSLLMKLKDKNKHTIILLDHIGLLRIDSAKSLYEQTTEVAKELRQMCLEYDCTIITASQLNRGSYKEKIGLQMLKDSGELENSASKVILLYKTKEEDNHESIVNMTVEIAKNRDGMMGYIKMEYDKPKQIFKEID